MTDKKDVTGEGTVLRGNFTPRAANDPTIAAAEHDKSSDLRRTEEFEKAARNRIGGSISFVTRLKDPTKDVLLWKGDED